MKKNNLKNDIKELKLAVIIIGFVLLAYASPAIWNKFDYSPVVASSELGDTGLQPLPKPEYIIKSYFYYIDYGITDNALELMHPKYIEYSKKIWELDFNNVYFAKLRTIELLKEEEGAKQYRVRLDVRLKGNDLKTNWKNGENIREISLAVHENQWLITDIK